MEESSKISMIQILILFLKTYRKKKKERGSSLGNQCINKSNKTITLHKMYNYKAISLLKFKKIII
jgi:hypothetical protein